MADQIKPYRGPDACRACEVGSLATDVLALQSEGVPPENAGHQLIYRHRIVRACGQCGAGVLEALDHDCFNPDWDAEPWDIIIQYELAAADIDRLIGLVHEGCSQPLAPDCACTLHTSLRASCAALPRTSTRGLSVRIALSPLGEPALFVVREITPTA